MAPAAAAATARNGPAAEEKSGYGIRAVLLGPPGSGKGTQVSNHSTRFSILALEMRRVQSFSIGKYIMTSTELV